MHWVSSFGLVPTYHVMEIIELDIKSSSSWLRLRAIFKYSDRESLSQTCRATWVPLGLIWCYNKANQKSIKDDQIALLAKLNAI